MKANTLTEILAQDAWLQPKAGPRYLQFSRHLTQQISKGHLPPDAPLPSEREMAHLSNLSRVTIRKAIEVLVNSKLVIQRHGSGTFVAPQVQKLEHSLSHLTSFTEDMQRRGKSSSSEVISVGLVTPSPDEIIALGLRSGGKVARIERLRRGDDVAMAIERSSLPTDILPDPTQIKTSLYEVLDQRGLRPERAVQRISASLLSGKTAKLLETSTGAAALKIERTAYDPSGRAIEFTTGIYRGDAYDFVAELRT